jgi:DNA-binding HxlR family transcriptional regulator
MKQGFGQFCPVAVACEVFAERWTPIILRELFAGAQLFNEIHRGIPLISRPLLARRLRELEAAGVITMESLPSGRGHRYCLTEAGNEFRPVIEGLGAWGQRWTVRLDRRNLDPGLLMWNMRRRIAVDSLPSRRVVVRLKFSGVAPAYRGPRIFWLMLERTQVDLCIEDPGFEVDLYVEADLAAMAKVWLGDASFESVLRSKEVALTGPRELAKMFPTWLMLSHFAAVPRPERQASRETESQGSHGRSGDGPKIG